MLRYIKITACILIIASTAAYSQEVIKVSGQVLDENTGIGLPMYPVFADANDSLLFDFFMTDPNGYFEDSLFTGGMAIDYLRFYTFDCHGLPQDTVVTDLLAPIFVEFRICSDSIPVGCQASFSVALDSLSPDPNVYRFQDLSTGDIDIWFWDFGDGNVSYQQHPVHQYADSGQYSVCLTVASNTNPILCNDTYCQEIVTPAYFNIGGLTWAGDYPLNNPVFSNDTGLVSLYRLSDSQLRHIESKLFHENGYYWFVNVLEGDYVIKISLTEGSSSYSNYMPTYFGDQVSWDAAQLLSLDSHAYDKHVHLVAAEPMVSGPGFISGELNFTDNEPASVENIDILLSDQENHPLRFTRSDAQGQFEFTNLPYGTYLVKADYTGRPSQTYSVTLTPSSPISGSVELTVGDSAFFDIQEPADESVSLIRLFPNPAGESVNISLEIKKNMKGILAVTDFMGRIWIKQEIVLHPAVRTYRCDVSSLPPGIYILRIQPEGSSLSLTGKFVK